ncbi:MAG TPA: hypothetical protein VEI25_00240, partial [Paraburkholderia sp.]|nr:hypothetical protein [Paraburkholderia sp.]
NRVTDTAPAIASAKSESNNPACSVACRPGISMIWNAEERGPLSRGKAIAEPTHGLALTAMPDEGRLVAKGKVI